MSWGLRTNNIIALVEYFELIGNQYRKIFDAITFVCAFAEQSSITRVRVLIDRGHLPEGNIDSYIQSGKRSILCLVEMPPPC
jgi:hypothetical protein